ncbi:hypothetical protein [Polyangium spumosum]|uniref:Uncharacterized protein n=1 Tax=Polyangium spumosum TaxID=889282 RepID=A0A6N7PRX8_9BACT|nr:hypothetical protein [Polyangium spumosum]MRG94932.1 hypothetical protein [Polyangium spumosum]
MPTSREEAQRLLEQARNDAWWGGMWGRVGWALDHIIDFASGFFSSFTPSYSLTLSVLRRVGVVSESEYQQLTEENTMNRAGQTTGYVASIVVGSAATAKAGGTMFSVYLGNSMNPTVYRLNSVVALQFLHQMMQQANVWVKP